MPELLKLETLDWRLVVWSKDISSSQKQLSQTLHARSKAIPSTVLRFNPPLYFSDLDCREDEYCMGGNPLFFENKLYEFDFQFLAGRISGEPIIKHRLQTVEDAFHYSVNSLRNL